MTGILLKYYTSVSEVDDGIIRILLFMVIVPMIFLNGCVETIDFDVDRTGGHLVVDGMITNAPGPHQIKLRQTADREKISDPLSGATILIKDNLGNSEYLTEVSEGVYEFAGTTLKGTPGQSYSIEITLAGNDSVYRSVPEVMPATLASDSIYYEFDTIQELTESGNSTDVDVIRVLRNTVVPETEFPVYLKWNIDEVYKFTEYDFPDALNKPPPSCYITDYPEAQNIHLYDGSKLDPGIIDTETMAERELDYTFYQLRYINVTQYSITRRAHDYWKQVNQIVNQSGTIFDVPPANAHSNIFNINDPSETVLGYFHAASVDSSRFFVRRSNLPFDVFNPCRTQNGPDCVGGCGRIKNSSPNPPFYWLND